MADLTAGLTGSLAVIGCGNPNRGDDGVGPDIVARLRERMLPAGVRVHDAGTDGIGVMYRARGASHLVIVDARAPDGAPGSIHDVPGDVLEAAPPPGLSLHAFRWDHALYTGRMIYGAAFPRHVRVVLIEAESLALGIGLTACVSRAAIRVCARIGELAEDFAAGRWA